VIVPPVVRPAPSRVRLHVTREHAQRDGRRDEHRACGKGVMPHDEQAQRTVGNGRGERL